MNNEPSTQPLPRVSLLRSWTTLSGLVLVLASLFAFLLLFLLDSLAHFSNPYIGILTYLVAPFFLFVGLIWTALAVIVRRRRLAKGNGSALALQINLSRPRDRRIFGIFIAVSVVFLLFTAVETYHTYHYTESVQFCGQACHTVMKPELVTYQHGPHARVACTECHIGPGAKWYVRSKLSGMYQVYAVAFDKYPRPVPTPIKNLRPAQETCEQCHWPKKFAGNLDRTYNYFLADETNTPFSIRLTMKVGGGDPTHGPVGGIHWHMNVGNQVEYYAATNANGVWSADEARQTIPWVRVIDKEQGVVTEYRVKNFTNAVSQAQVRTMDCMDCHNRPAHMYETPNDAVNLAMALNKIDRSIPWVKSNAVYALTKNYTNETQALQTIATILAEKYPADKFAALQPGVRSTIGVVQQIYTNNFFPEMKARWQAYPDNIGHKDWAGCFRCHDGNHMTADGKRSIKASDCNTCHTILAQGTGAELDQLTPNGQKFKHPGDEVDGACNDCHSGGL